MRTNTPSLYLTRSKLRADLLALFFLNPEASYYLRELERRLEVSPGALARELDWQNSEDEIVLTASGQRFVPRMRILRQDDPAEKKSSRDKLDVYRLGFQMPGQLRNLRWERYPHVAPGEDQLEVEIHATGLNFRDIMYALGLLSDEAIENGFAGATLGLEFTGTVIHAGSKTSGFAPGDKVVLCSVGAGATMAALAVEW